MVKKWVALLLSCAMVLAGALTSWALPSGASMTEGNTVKSSKAGFVLTFPEGFEIISGWPGEAYQYFPEEGIHWDFSASISDETEEHFLTMAGMWVPLEGKSLEQQMAELIQTWTEEGVGTSSTPYLQTGTAAVADGGYYSIKINYGALLAESMRQLYGKYGGGAERRGTGAAGFYDKGSGGQPVYGSVPEGDGRGLLYSGSAVFC